MIEVVRLPRHLSRKYLNSRILDKYLIELAILGQCEDEDGSIAVFTISDSDKQYLSELQTCFDLLSRIETNWDRFVYQHDRPENKLYY